MRLVLLKKGQLSPSFFYLVALCMINKNKIIKIIGDYFQGSDKFLVNVKITSQNKVMVFLDSDSEVTISDCAKLSKHIEKLFDRNEEDYELEVSSAGVGKPLMVLRQYLKNIGRDIVVKTVDDKKIKGKLLNAESKGVEIEIGNQKTDKEKKNKNTHATAKSSFVEFDQIKEAKIKPTF